MSEARLKDLLDRLSRGDITVEEVVSELRYLPFTDLGFAKVDLHRELRAGVPEAVYAPGKTPEQVAGIAIELRERGRGPVLVTRADLDHFAAVSRVAPEAHYDETSRLIVVRPSIDPPSGVVLVASAGTSDLPVAEEAAQTADAIGLKVERIYDVGVAGLHRILSARDALERAEVVVVVAGMDGALPSIVGGLVSVPVVAVPTSVGYGAGAGGIAPLLTMLNSCAPGVAVVNIDNGYGAAVFARMALRR